MKTTLFLICLFLLGGLAATASATSRTITWDYPAAELARVDEFRVYDLFEGARVLKATVKRADARTAPAQRAGIDLVQPGEHVIVVTAYGQLAGESTDSQPPLRLTEKLPAPTGVRLVVDVGADGSVRVLSIAAGDLELLTATPSGDATAR